MRRLPQRRPLILADGELSAWIEWETEAQLQVGDHVEPLTFFVTTLAMDNPIILGLPWLRRHNPKIDWDSLSLTFRGHCSGRCLPYYITEQEAPSAKTSSAPKTVPPPSPSPYRTTVEEVPDEGEPDWEPEQVTRMSAAAREKRSRHRREWRQRQRLQDLRERALANGPRWTSAPPHARAVMIPNAKPTSPAPARLTAGIRSATPQLRPRARAPAMAPTVRRERINNKSDIQLLGAPNFLLLSRQKGVTIMRTTFAELEEAVRNAPESDIHLPDLPE
ncbi:hypothetical protein C8A03DRAFT_39613, partial [Achaetomium macrosporum]